MDRENSKAAIRKTIIAFSGPIVAELMLMSLIAMVNLAMVGHLGAYALSAVGLTNQPVLISMSVFQSFNVGATALVSRFIGARDYVLAKRVIIQTMMISVFMGGILAIIGIVFSREIVTFLGAQPDTVDYATMYMKYMSLGMLFQAIPTAVTSILRGSGESKIPMRYNVVSNIVNAVAGFVLIYGVGFLPGLELRGAAIATTLAKLVACLMSIYALINLKLPISISFRDSFKFDYDIIKRIMNIGISAAAEQFTMRIALLLYSRIIANLGTMSFAAHQVISGITQLVSNVINGLSIAASSFVGRHLGAKRPDLAEAYVHQITRIGLVISLTVGSTFFWGGKYLARIYTSEIEVILIAASVLKIATFIVFPQNYLSILSGSLRGAGDTKWPMYSAILGMMARVGLATFLVKVCGWGLEGAWMAAVSDQSVRAMMVFYRFRTGKWKKIEV